MIVRSACGRRYNEEMWLLLKTYNLKPSRTLLTLPGFAAVVVSGLCCQTAFGGADIVPEQGMKLWVRLFRCVQYLSCTNNISARNIIFVQYTPQSDTMDVIFLFPQSDKTC